MPSFLCYSFTKDQIVVINQDLAFLFEAAREYLGIVSGSIQKYAIALHLANIDQTHYCSLAISKETDIPEIGF